MTREELHKLGYREGFMPLPPEHLSADGPAIVLGRAGDWLFELDTALSLTGHDAPVFAVNAGHPAGGHYLGLAPLDHIVSTHCQYFPAERGETIFHTNKPEKSCAHADVRWPLCGVSSNGSSALLGAHIALLMGHAPVYVAGVHLMDRTVTKDGNKRMINDYKVFRSGWVALAENLPGRVFSVSPEGTFLRDLFGGPHGV